MTLYFRGRYVRRSYSWENTAMMATNLPVDFRNNSSMTNRKALVCAFDLRPLVFCLDFVFWINHWNGYSRACLGILTALMLLGPSKTPSSAFCLLLRLLTLRCTEKQMTLLLSHPDSPYIRGIGFLYLRYAGEPDSIWKWIEPYLYDDEPIQVQANASKTNKTETIGEYVRFLFTTRDYYGTILPRLPIDVERTIQVQLLQAEKYEERAQQHMCNPKHMSYFQTLGAKVMALYGDDENPIQWYEAVVDRVMTTNQETGRAFKYPKFVVTFPEYGNTEIVTLGEMEMPGASLENTNHHHHHHHQDSKLHRRASRDDEEQNGGNGPSTMTRNSTLERGYGGAYRSDDRLRDYQDRRYDRGRGYDEVNDRAKTEYDNDRGGGSSARDYNNSRSRRGQGREGNGGGRWERGGGSRSTAASTAPAIPQELDLYEEVRRRERETVLASGRNAVARRPPSTKTSLLAPSQDRHRRTPSPSPPPLPPPPPSTAGHAPPPPSSDEVAPRKRSAEEIAAMEAKKRKLLAKYG